MRLTPYFFEPALAFLAAVFFPLERVRALPLERVTALPPRPLPDFVEAVLRACAAPDFDDEALDGAALLARAVPDAVLRAAVRETPDLPPPVN